MATKNPSYDVWKHHPILAAAESMLLYIKTYGGQVTSNYAAAFPQVEEAIRDYKRRHGL